MMGPEPAQVARHHPANERITMQINQEEFNVAVAQENALMQEATIQHLNQRVSVLRAQVNRLVQTCEENGIDPDPKPEEEPEEVTPIRRPQDRRPAKKAAAKKKSPQQ